MRYFIPFLLLFICGSLAAQDLRIGQWKSHLPYTRGHSVTQSDDQIFVATPFSIFTIDKEDFSFDFHNKVTGLSEAGIGRIRYNDYNETLLIAYESSNIDLLEGNMVTNISDIERFDIVGDKTIYHINFKDDFAYLSCGFGVVVLDMSRKEVASTTFTNSATVKASCIKNDILYAATTEGIYTFDLNSSKNALDFSDWDLETGNGLPPTYRSDAICLFNDQLYADVNDSIYLKEQGQWTFLHHEEGYAVQYLQSNQDFIIANMIDSPFGSKLIFIEADNSIVDVNFSSYVGDVAEAIQDPESEIVWMVDSLRGTGRYYYETGFLSKFSPRGPYSHNIHEVHVYEDQVWVAPGGKNPSWNHLNLQDGFFSFIDGEWKSYRQFEYPELSGVWDFLHILVNPNDGKTYAASFKQGLAIWDGNTVEVFNEETSLQKPINDITYRISGMALDEETGDLWMTNHLAPNPISVRYADGTWENFNLPNTFQELGPVAIDNNGYKWMVNLSGGVIVFDEGDAETAPRYKLLTSSNTEIPNNNVNCIEVDLEGDVWVGTKEGAVVFQCASQVFTDQGCIGDKKVIEDDEDFGGHLLSTEVITSIAVDGANRKWFGTLKGIFVMSPDAEVQEAKFDEDNSPLFDNRIRDIAINHKNGEVFIGTEKGLISYRGEATEGGNVFASDVYAYPNPVRPDYEGPIAIKGLVRDANVKITDVSGRLVYETTALGGQAIWNGRDYNDRKANTGVYLVYATDKQGQEKYVTKVLFIR